jgi:hypothetical protein
MNIIHSLQYWLAPVSLLLTQIVIVIVFIVNQQRGRRLRMLESQYSPFWRVFQTEVADTLHHPHPESRELDGLLEKLEALTMTDSERDRLVQLLREIADDPNSEERSRAEFLLFAMPRVVREREQRVQPGDRTIDMSPSKKLTKRNRYGENTSRIP